METGTSVGNTAAASSSTSVGKTAATSSGSSKLARAWNSLKFLVAFLGGGRDAAITLLMACAALIASCFGTAWPLLLILAGAGYWWQEHKMQTRMCEEVRKERTRIQDEHRKLEKKRKGLEDQLAAAVQRQKTSDKRCAELEEQVKAEEERMPPQPPPERLEELARMRERLREHLRKQHQLGNAAESLVLCAAWSQGSFKPERSCHRTEFVDQVPPKKAASKYLSNTDVVEVFEVLERAQPAVASTMAFCTMLPEAIANAHCSALGAAATPSSATLRTLRETASVPQQVASSKANSIWQATCGKPCNERGRDRTQSLEIIRGSPLASSTSFIDTTEFLGQDDDVSQNDSSYQRARPNATSVAFSEDGFLPTPPVPLFSSSPSVIEAEYPMDSGWTECQIGDDLMDLKESFCSGWQGLTEAAVDLFNEAVWSKEPHDSGQQDAFPSLLSRRMQRSQTWSPHSNSEGFWSPHAQRHAEPQRPQSVSEEQESSL